ncbi:hypothetical protein OOK13_44670 [Streptomyces sp. NBC_00378]|uniref:hypothetical protein n=1 Tax=unclassified Streptomyces TaxID=2593676 RepID=UPI002253F9D9|nr:MULTISPECIES: hypothetical protein [unclassified Streptomyces]MCX5115400.1 hypothetical protein [Streptomyces sp. NBC_00378]
MVNADLRKALVRGREAVDETTRFWLTVNGRWDEEVATARLCERSAPFLQPITFNRAQEARLGADWLWWFIDRESETCFGMLCQAKNLKKDGSRWKIGFGQANKTGAQMKLLSRAAESLQVPAVYILYCGDERYRDGLACRTHSAFECETCARAGVSVISALGAQYLCDSYSTDANACAVAAFQRSQPVEDLVAPETPDGALWDMNFHECVGALQAFLSQPQYGAARVAKQLFDQLSSLRGTQLSRMPPALELMTLPRNECVHPILPTDRGHLPRPYFRDVLQGLRKAVPTYVRDAEAGRFNRLPAKVTSAVNGIVITYV